MTGPECAEGHDKVPMLNTGEGSWRCPKCLKKVPPDRDVAESEVPKGLNLEETLWVLRNVPHEPYEYPSEVLEEFDRLMEEIEQEVEGSETEAVRDASTNLDDYIYG